MKTILPLILSILAGFALPAASAKVITLKDGLPLGQMMEENDVFIKTVGDLCLHDDSLFLSDMRKGQVLQVDIRSGKLIRAISSLGQGPAELQRPRSLVVRNGKVYVMDQGFCGIKVFTTAGAFLASFKLHSCQATEKSFAVGERDEIFVPEGHAGEKTLVSVYSLDGKRLRGLVHGSLEQKSESEYLRQNEFNLRLDRKGNIYLLFNLGRRIEKYDAGGKLTWKKAIRNDLLDRFPEDDGVLLNPRGGWNIRSRVYDLEVDVACRVFIVHSGGICVLDEQGDISFLLKSKTGDSSFRNIAVNLERLVSQTFFSTSDLRLLPIKGGFQ